MNNSAETYGWESATTPDSGNYISPKVLKILESLRCKRVCDLGSGNGAMVGLMQEAGYYAVGVEQDFQGTVLSRQNFPNNNFYNLGIQDNPAHMLAAEGQPFDIVTSTEVIEHLFSPHLLPSFAQKLLTEEGGYLVISTPYHGYLKNLALSLFDAWDKHLTPLWHGGHIKFWSRKTLTQLLQENGFEVIAFYGVGRLPWLWKSMILVGKKVTPPHLT